MSVVLASRPHARRARLTVNGDTVEADIEPRTHLADFVRDDLHLTGTHLGCEHGVCGACTILLDGEPARSCLTFAAACDGADVVTIEGLDDDAVAAELRAAFTREHALQCGFCTPGMLVAARDLVLRLSEPDERRVRLGLSGNLCRCTGYAGIVRAVMAVIADRQARGETAGGHEASRMLGPVGAHCPSVEDVPASLHAVSGPESAAGTKAPPIPVDGTFSPAHRFRQTFTVAFPPEDVFALFGEVEAVAACLPGAFVEHLPAPDRIVGGLRVQLGPIRASFRGQAVIERDEAARTGRILGAGADAGGRSATQGEIRYAVTPDETTGTTSVTLDVGYTLKGPLAQFGRPGLVRDIASRLTSSFAGNLEARLAGAPATRNDVPSGLNPARLLFSLAFDRLMRGWRRLIGRDGPRS
ncbi:xanthine dehydrogenase family Fe-S subunit [Marinivivus vitaminiproducens]|uniref:xanthine dehydrogenase family Fe-S subunit n=1 Tax=Marinivivus vitaminiproducens TaxID=3035935 RepID=UPI00279F94B2|nr:2Fe-2S iron-sulfur cluster-binding protein [Geminicoccaceae bacterium SCSIO 64248]